MRDSGYQRELQKLYWYDEENEKYLGPENCRWDKALAYFWDNKLIVYDECDRRRLFRENIQTEEKAIEILLQERIIEKEGRLQTSSALAT